MTRWERWARGRERTIGAIAVAAAAAVALVVGSLVEERRSGKAVIGSSTPGANRSAESGPTVSEPPVEEFVPPVTGKRSGGRDYLLDLTTGVRKPLPKAILRSRIAARGDTRRRSPPRYAVSPKAPLLAYVGRGDDGRRQIFVAAIDGSDMRQVTHDPIGAQSPAWSPDGASIAYVGHGSGAGASLFLVDLATGESTQVTHTNITPWAQPQVTPDGAALLYTGGSGELLTVPIAGGRSTPLFPLTGGLQDSVKGSLSPDGSLVTFLRSGTFGFGQCGPCRWVAHADGTHRRVIEGCFEAVPAGTWSPDGGRIVCMGDNDHTVTVIDLVMGGTVSHVAEGTSAIWVDRTTLLVEAS